MFGPLTGLLCKQPGLETAAMNTILHLRQFASDVVRLVDLWMLLCGAAISLFLAWLF
jgi:hypothetical protein